MYSTSVDFLPILFVGSNDTTACKTPTMTDVVDADKPGVGALSASQSSVERICRAFRNTGECRYGDACKFEHTTGAPIEPPPRAQCYAFRDTGECAFGTRCRFLHGDEDWARFGSKVKRTTRKTKNTNKNSKNATASRGAGSSRRRSPRHGHRGGESGDRRQKSLSPRQARNRRRQEKRATMSDTLVEACNLYAAGKCRHGDRCRWPHVGEIEQRVDNKLDETCNNYREGRCHFGDLCRRIHEET